MADNTQGADGYYGQRGLSDPLTTFDAVAFQIFSMLGETRTIVPVQVVAVTGGGLDAPAMVDVHPLINQTDGVGNSTPHGNVLDLAVVRWQAGTSAVIMDPVVGDIGLALICDRDISALKATKAQANPGSKRRFNLADGVYLGGILGSTVAQYLVMSADGVKVVSPTKITLQAPVVETDGNFQVTGTITAGLGTGDLVTLQNHRHTGNNIIPTPGF